MWCFRSEALNDDSFVQAYNKTPTIEFSQDQIETNIFHLKCLDRLITRVVYHSTNLLILCYAVLFSFAVYLINLQRSFAACLECC